MRGKNRVGISDPYDLANPKLCHEYIFPGEEIEGEELLQPDQRRVIAHLQPVFYVDDDGVVQDVDLTQEDVLEDGETPESKIRVIRNVRKGLESKIRADGHVLISRGKYKLDMVLIRRGVSSTTGEAADVPDLDFQSNKAIHKKFYDDVDCEYEMRPTGIKENVILQSKPASLDTGKLYWNLVWAYDTENLTAEMDGDGNIQWKRETDETLFVMPKPVVTDANGIELTANYLLTVNNEIAVRVRSNDLDTAAYPVVVDPTTTFTLTGNAQDKQATNNDTSLGTSGTWSGKLSGFDSLTDSGNEMFLRLDNVDDYLACPNWTFPLAIGKDATISSAYLKVYSSGRLASGTITWSSSVQARKKASSWYAASDFTITNYKDTTNYPLTTAQVVWLDNTNSGTWTANTQYTSPDIKTVIQEIVNDALWVSGNLMWLDWKIDSWSGFGSTEYIGLGVKTYESGSSNSAVLEITYTDSGGGSINSGTAGAFLI